jgi:hypothetical protein
MPLLHKIPFDWKQRAILQGRGFHVDIGAFSTPILGGGAGTIIDLDRPEGCISIPSGTTIIPIRISAQCQIDELATDADENEILFGVDIAKSNDGTGTHTSETALKMYLGQGTSLCTCWSAETADTTDPAIGMELARTVIVGDVQTAVGVLWTKLDLLYEPVVAPVLVGPCALYLYWGGTVANSGFAQIEWLEYLSSEI